MNCRIFRTDSSLLFELFVKYFSPVYHDYKMSLTCVTTNRILTITITAISVEIKHWKVKHWAMTALIAAAYEGNVTIVPMLLQSGKVHVDQQTSVSQYVDGINIILHIYLAYTIC